MAIARWSLLLSMERELGGIDSKTLGLEPGTTQPNLLKPVNLKSMQKKGKVSDQ
jgi:hypothetical protein